MGDAAPGKARVESTVTDRFKSLCFIRGCSVGQEMPVEAEGNARYHEASFTLTGGFAELYARDCRRHARAHSARRLRFLAHP